MAIKLNSKEVLEIAVGIEENGEKFYRLAADKVKDGDLKKMLKSLADWEKGHRLYFLGLLEGLENSHDGLFATEDMEEEVSLYLKAIADSNVFKTGMKVEDLLGNLQDAGAILDKALEREKDAVAYFSALKYSFSSPEDQLNIDKIILEELSHIRYLTEKRREL
jgi:rubrerythrin